MGGEVSYPLAISSNSSSPQSQFLSLSEFRFDFPLWMSEFSFCSFRSIRPEMLCVGATHVHAELSHYGWMPGARLHNQQITPSPQSATALLRLLSINCAMTSCLETSFAAGSSTPMHFLFPVKKIYSQLQLKTEVQLYQHLLHTDTVFSGRYFRI